MISKTRKPKRANANRVGDGKGRDRKRPTDLRRGRRSATSASPRKRTGSLLEIERSPGAIEPGQYLTVHGCNVITADMVACWYPGRLASFLKWMSGQTGIMIPGTNGMGIYLDDFNRWRAGLPVID